MRRSEVVSLVPGGDVLAFVLHRPEARTALAESE